MRQVFRIITSGADRFVRAIDHAHAVRIARRAFTDDDGIPTVNVGGAALIGPHVPRNVGTVAYDTAVASFDPEARAANRAARKSGRTVIAVRTQKRIASDAAGVLAALGLAA